MQAMPSTTSNKINLAVIFPSNIGRIKRDRTSTFNRNPLENDIYIKPLIILFSGAHFGPAASEIPMLSDCMSSINCPELKQLLGIS